MGKLTALQVKNAREGRHLDGKGLYLLVKPTGARSWVLRIVVDGRRRDFGLGPVDLVTLQEARDKAIEGRRLVRNGMDPGIEWKRVTTIIPTFEQAARQYHETVKASWKNGKHGDQWLTTLQTHAFPLLGSRRVDQIDAPAIQAVLMSIWLALPETARRVRQRVCAVLDYSHGKGWRGAETPRGALNSLMRGTKQPRRSAGFAAMPYAELPTFMAALRKEEPTAGRLGLMFVILTAARSGEVRGASWPEINWQKGRWDIPGARMKMGEPHGVPLSATAVDVLGKAKFLATGKSETIFPGIKAQPLSDATLAKALRVAGGDAYTVHGMRSAFRDWCAEQTSFPREWAEAALAHTLPNKVEAAYLRTKYLEQRRKVMDAWAEYLVGESNVIRLAAAK